MAPVENQSIVIVAQYALYVVAAAAVVVWLMASRSDKVSLAIEAVVAMVLVAVMVKVAGAVHADPRPFVQNPGLKPMFPHPADNGFPSDHTALATAISVVVWHYRRPVAWAMLVLSVMIGVARVAAHVHYTQDIVAALIIGVVAALGARALWRQGVKPRLTGNLASLTS
ncbi:MAG: phosphatase PAP2 family protein [Actinomycetota bacterium]